jgi:hypothetical protein
LQTGAAVPCVVDRESLRPKSQGHESDNFFFVFYNQQAHLTEFLFLHIRLRHTAHT